MDISNSYNEINMNREFPFSHKIGISGSLFADRFSAFVFQWFFMGKAAA
jgi:hypothetical protein